MIITWIDIPQFKAADIVCSTVSMFYYFVLKVIVLEFFVCAFVIFTRSAFAITTIEA